MTKRNARPVDPPTRFVKVTDKMLADELGAIDEDLAAVKERQEEARLEMSRRGKWAIEGHVFTVLKAVSETSSIDTGAIRKEMGEAWCDARSKPGTRTTYRIGRKGEPAAAEPAPAPKPRAAKPRKAAEATAR